MEYVPIFLTIAMVQFLAAASPGPSLILVSNHASASSRKVALQSAAGVLLATVTWATMAIFGVGVAVIKYPTFYTAIQYLGAAYLFWLGLRMLLCGLKNRYSQPGIPQEAKSGPRSAVLEGYFVNMTNPKTVAYYTSLFTALIPANADQWVILAGGLVAVSVSVAWWVTVALVFSTGLVKHYFSATRRGIDLFMGGALIFLSIRLAASR